MKYVENYTDNWNISIKSLFISLKKAQAVVQKTSRKNVTSTVLIFYVEYIYGFVWWGVCRQSRWRHSVTVPYTRWRICVTMATLWQQQDGGFMLLWRRYGNNKMAAILHLQQYSRRLTFFSSFLSFWWTSWVEKSQST